MDNNNNGKKGEGTIRARNKTVMLSPELAGQVRAKMASELAKNKPPVSIENQGGIHRPTVKPPAPQEPQQPVRSGVINRAEAPTSVRRNTGNFSVAGNPPVSPVRRSQESTPQTYANDVVYRDEPVHVKEVVEPPPVMTEQVEEESYELQPEEPVRASASRVTRTESHPTVSVTGVRTVYTKKGKVIGFLVSYDRDADGEFVPLCVGRLMVSSDGGASPQDGTAGQWNMLIIPDETVSGMHAIMKVQAGEIHILDQLSEHGTRIVKAGSAEVVELSQARGVAAHGDTVQFGKRTFVVCMVP